MTTTTMAPVQIDPTDEAPCCEVCGLTREECDTCKACGSLMCGCEGKWVEVSSSCYGLQDSRTADDVPESGFYCSDDVPTCDCPGCDPWGYAERMWEARTGR